MIYDSALGRCSDIPFRGRYRSERLAQCFYSSNLIVILVTFTSFRLQYRQQPLIFVDFYQTGA